MTSLRAYVGGLGPLLGPSWGLRGRSWPVFGRSWGLRRRSWPEKWPWLEQELCQEGCQPFCPFCVNDPNDPNDPKDRICPRPGTNFFYR